MRIRNSEERKRFIKVSRTLKSRIFVIHLKPIVIKNRKRKENSYSRFVFLPLIASLVSLLVNITD